MKKSIVILLISLASITICHGQQYGWVDISSNLPKYLHDTTIINAGADTLIANLTDICFINDNEGWVVAWHSFSSDSGTILHTSDGGITWQVQTLMRPCQVIHMVDQNVGYAGSDGGLLFKTIDGGQHWNYYGITGAPVTGMSFIPNSDTGYVCSYMSSSLQQITPAGTNNISLGNTGWWHSISAPSHNLIWISDGTSVWTFDVDGLTDQPVTSSFYNSIDFVRNDLGWGAGHDGVKEKNQGTISGCIGKNIPWVHLKYTDQPLYEVFAFDVNHVWAAGFNGYIYYSDNASDFGFDTLTSTGWSNVNFVSQPNPRPDCDFLSLFFTSPQNGFASGGKNVLLKYTQISSVAKNEIPFEINVCPNPATSTLDIECPQSQNRMVTLFNLMGEQVMQRHFAGTKASVDISSLPLGMYIVKVSGGDWQVQRKVVKE